MVEKTAAFKQRRAADTARWRERLQRGAAVYPVEVDGTTFDLMQRLAASRTSRPGGRCNTDAHRDRRAVKNLSPRAYRTTQALGSRLATLQFNFGGSSSLRSVRDGASMHACRRAKPASVCARRSTNIWRWLV